MTAPGPLDGLTVVVTRPEHQAGPLAERLVAAGAGVLRLPALTISPIELDAAARRAATPDAFDWLVFTSANAVREALRQLPKPHFARVAAVGRATARALEEAGVAVAAVPEHSATSEGLLALPAFGDDIRGRRVLILRGVGGRELLRDALRERGAEVAVAELYRRDPGAVTAEHREALAKALRRSSEVVVAINSVETLDGFLGGLDAALREQVAGVPLLLPATRIAEAAAARGLRGPVILASGAEDEAVVAALVGWRRGAGPPARATIPGGGDDPTARPSH